MADENRDDIVADPEQKTSNAAANTSTSTAPVNNDQSVNTPPNNNMGSGHPLDPNNSALGDSVWLGMNDNELAAEAGRLRDNEDEFPTLNSSLSGLGDNKSPTNQQSKDAPANKGANTSVLDRLNAANGKTEEVKKNDDTNTAEKGANTDVLDRLNASNKKAEDVKAQTPKDDFDIDSILAAAKTNTAQVNDLKARTTTADATPKGPAPKQKASNAKGDAKSSEEEPDDDNPELDDEEEYEYDADGNRIVRTNPRRVNTGLGAQVRVNSSSKNNTNQSQANPKAANQNTANKNAAANNNQSTASTGNAQASNNNNPAAASATPAAGTTAAAGVNTNQAPSSRPQQNSGQPANQPQNGGGRPSGAAQGGNMPSSGGGGGGGGTLGQNLGGLITNTVGLAKNTVGVAASAVGALPAFANAVKTGTNNLVSKKTTTSATPAGTTATTPTTRVPIPTSTLPNAKTPGGVPLTNATAGQPAYSMNGLRPIAPRNQLNAANYKNLGKPTNNLAPGPRLNLQYPLPPHKNLTPVNNNVIPISAAQKKTAPITPATAAAISANRTNQPNNQASAKQFIQNLAQKSQQKKQGLFAGLPADNPMHNLPSTTKQALEDAHNARNSINDNLSSIENDNPIGTLRDKKQKGLNDGFRNYADSSEAANELLKNNNKNPGDREASLEATKYLNDMNKDVSKNTDTAKNKKLLDKDNDTNLQDKMKNIVESTKKIMESIKTTIENVAKLFTRNKPKP